MGLFGMSGDTWKKIGGYALKAAPYVAAPFTGGLSIPIGMAINGGVGAAQGAMNGGGWKGAALGGGLGAGLAAVPGGAAASGSVKSLIAPTLGGALKTAGIQTGIGVGTNLLNNLANKGAAPPASNPNVYTNALPQQTGAPNMSTPGSVNAFAPTSPGGTGLGPQAVPPYMSTTGGGSGSPASEPRSSYTSTGENAAGNNATDETGAPNPSAPDTTTSFGEKWGPLIAQGAGLGAGIFAGKAATASAMQRSPEEQAALGNTNTAAAGLTGAGNSLLSESKPYMRNAGSYYNTLLHGNRAAMSEATAAPRAQLQQQLRGAKSQLDTSGVRGAARDVIGGRMAQDNAGKVAALTTGVQPGAADALAKLGTTQASLAQPLLASGGNLYNNLLGAATNNRTYARQQGAQTGEAIGKLASMAGTIPWGKKKPAAPGTPGTPGATPPAPGDYQVNGPQEPYQTYGPPMPPPTFTDTGDYSNPENY